ncbi:hypothetical protein BST95_07105 [Halioglobus japonicus]|uniref:hypothetical protein n=1 Tax=Halioglobus japonicus TaxID=930805 RepID=UPI0009790A0B|nr:hypothetical protein [Halioglobus japonicus]AQA18044.1 hypothetical protein BST95_07105 [Halioglobus japonicus]
MLLGHPVEIVTLCATEVDGDQPALYVSKMGGHGLHLAELHGDHHRIQGIACEGLARRGVHLRVVVTAGAVLVKQALAKKGQGQFVRMLNGKTFNCFQRLIGTEEPDRGCRGQRHQQ